MFMRAFEAQDELERFNSMSNWDELEMRWIHTFLEWETCDWASLAKEKFVEIGE